MRRIATFLPGALPLLALVSPISAMAQEKDIEPATTRVIVVNGSGLEAPPAAPAYNVQTIERERIVGGLYPLYREPGSHEMMFHTAPEPA